MLANLVNGLCAIATGSSRKKDETLSGKLSEGRVSFEDALSHIYPETTPRKNSGGYSSGAYPSISPAQVSTQDSVQTPYQYSGQDTALSQNESQAHGQAAYANEYGHELEAEPQSITVFETYSSVWQNQGYESAARQTKEIELSYGIPEYAIPDEQFSGDAGQHEELDYRAFKNQSQTDTYDNLPAVQATSISIASGYADSFLTGEQYDERPVDYGSENLIEPPATYDYVAPGERDYVARPYDKEAPLHQAQISEQILGNYAESVSPIRKAFLENVTTASAEFLATRGRPAQAAPIASNMSVAMTAVVDKIFSILEPYVRELNQTFRATDLSITSTPPSMVNETFDYDTMRRPSIVISSYRCRVSTSRLALVVRGREDRIEFFQLPVDRVMGLSKIEDQHQPLMVFCAEHRGGAIQWEVEGKPLTLERLERYVLLTFEHLLDVTREELLGRQGYVGVG